MKKKFSTDGFIAKRPSDRGKSQQISSTNSNFSKSEKNISLSALGDDLGKPKSSYGNNYFGTKSLNEAEELANKPTKKMSRRQRRHIEKRLVKKPRRLVFRIIKWFFLLILLAGLSIGAYAAYKLISAGSNIFQGSIIDIFSNKQPLKEDENGRSNFLILGTSEDDPGHDAPWLTDSIMVISINQDAEDAYMFNVPRDLNVEYGMACPEGYRGKINSYYECVNSTANDTDENAMASEQERLSAVQSMIGEIYGLDIQYTVHVNYTVLKEVVDAVGGIDVDIEGSNGESGILDRNADWRCNFECYYVKYDNGVYHLDGEHALYLALARGDDSGLPTYGLSRANPDREANQQKIIVALRDKAMSTGTLTNLGAISSLIDSLGGNLRTNIQMNEISTLLQVASSIKSENMHPLDLVVDGVMAGDGNPAAGDYNYKAIQEYIAKKLTNNPVISEEAPIVLLNGTTQAGLAQNKSNELTEAGYNIYYVDSATENTHETTEIYQVSLNSSGTATALSKLFGVTIKTTKPPIEVDSSVQFVIILGADVLSQE